MVGNEMKGSPDEQPEDRTEKIFSQMDKNNDGVLTKQEFIDGCLADDFLCQMLTANTASGAQWKNWASAIYNFAALNNLDHWAD